jgi:hypothetical protein
MSELQRVSDDRSLAELIGELAQEISTLVRQEVTLARVELGEKASRVGSHVVSLAAGGAIAYAGLLSILAAIIVLLAEAGLDWWASALLVGVVVAGTGGFLVMRGINSIKQMDLTPRQTLESLKEDAQWARKQTT